MTSLSWAARYNRDTNILNILLKFGANVNTKDNKGKSYNIFASYFYFLSIFYSSRIIQYSYISILNLC